MRTIKDLIGWMGKTGVQVKKKKPGEKPKIVVIDSSRMKQIMKNEYKKIEIVSNRRQKQKSPGNNLGKEERREEKRKRSKQLIS
jgi:hypothetical protein